MIPAVSRLRVQVLQHFQPQCVCQSVIYSPGGHIEIGVEADHGYAVLDQAEQQWVCNFGQRPENDGMMRKDQLSSGFDRQFHRPGCNIQRNKHFIYLGLGGSQQQTTVVPAHGQSQGGKALDPVQYLMYPHGQILQNYS